jgi:hypothetical protein
LRKGFNSEWTYDGESKAVVHDRGAFVLAEISQYKVSTEFRAKINIQILWMLKGNLLLGFTEPYIMSTIAGPVCSPGAPAYIIP